jgi:hypothetical protein
VINGIGKAWHCEYPAGQLLRSLSAVLLNMDPILLNREVIVLLTDKVLIPDMEFAELYFEEGK